jgi:hypothetical protein
MLESCVIGIIEFVFCTVSHLGHRWGTWERRTKETYDNSMDELTTKAKGCLFMLQSSDGR